MCLSHIIHKFMIESDSPFVQHTNMRDDKSIHVETRMAGGNACRVRFVRETLPTLYFIPDPKGGFPCWFYFRLKSKDGTKITQEKESLRLVMEHYDTLAGAHTPDECYPVYKASGQFWVRLPQGRIDRQADGRVCATWIITKPADDFELALCFPYEETDMKQLAGRGRGVWAIDSIGLSTHGREIRRFSNQYDMHGYSSSLYCIARTNGCDMPAAWLLDGLLQRLQSVKNNPFMTWAVPLADPDGYWYGAGLPAESFDPGHPTKQEHVVIRKDLDRWRQHGAGALILDIQAASLRETDGIYCTLPHAQRFPEWHERTLKWAHVIANKLGTAFASADFVRTTEESHRCNGLVSIMEVPSLTLFIPWCYTGDATFSAKKYREAGKAVADALIEKRH